MNAVTFPLARLLSCVIPALALMLHAPVLASQEAGNDAPIVRPGAPGKPPQVLSAEEAIRIANTSYSPADVRFMQDMIPHHYQAVQMAALVADRTNRPELIDIAGRIDASQDDEIAFMQQWLRERGEHVPEPDAHHGMHTSHHMAGMATPEQMAELATLKGVDFDRKFLELMIPHHVGAVRMVEELLEQPGSAYDPVLLEFTSDVTNDQETEIERMHALLIGLSPDPRAGLAAGFDNAGQAISNMQLVASLPKPPGFFDPANPGQMPQKRRGKDGDEHEHEHEHGNKPAKEEKKKKDESKSRAPLLSFVNTDIAFAGDVMAVGNYHGVNIYQLDKAGIPQLRSSVVCPGGQGDVSIVGDLLLMSVEQTRGRLDCGLQGVGEDISAERFRGLRIFDISDLARPLQVGAVQTCRGSHTHSVVASNDDEIIVYVSGTAGVRDEKELAGCIGDIPGDARTALFRIDVVVIPVRNPANARIVDSPAVFADSEAGNLAGLWRGGDHGDETQKTKRTDHCHDITVFPERNIAAGACSGNGIIFDISDPLNPQRIDAVVDAGFAYWHSATFNNDGTKVLFTDEWGGGSRARCRAHDPLNWGANAIYDIVDNKLVFRSHYKMPAPQSENENCVAHNGSIVPVPGRDIFVQAWYQGGISVIDFTDSMNPIEIAYFDRGPMSDEELVFGGYWSTYYYNGKIYGTETMRGLDVLSLIPSEHLSANEIAAAALADNGAQFNPQQQFTVTWPNHPVVALAYIDQLKRNDSLAASTATRLARALENATTRLANGGNDATLADTLESLAAKLGGEQAEELVTRQRTGLAQTLRGIAERLR